MRKLLAFLACLALCLASSIASESEYYGDSYARLSYVNGDVFVQRAEDLGYEEGVVNLAMIEGDKLGTREGRGEIHFGQRNYLRVDGYTQIDLVSLPQRGFDLIKLHLLSGNIFLRINHLERERDFEIHTPDASFYILDEGLYNLSVKSDLETELRVYAGAAEAAGETGSVLVKSIEKIVVADGRFISDPGYFYASYDDSFYEWNKSREALHNRYVARTYLPAELYEYEAELDDYGDWVYEGSYGHVWVPRVHHNTWRPYWNGRWVWYPIIGWNWVSYEPWGWCVSHYGRWQWRLGLGWYWIPTRHWGPAWVHWYHGADYYGWSPLSYYDYPGVIINNHYYARHNYHRAYPAHSRALVVVRKNQLQARHISRASLSGTQASRLGKVSLSSRQPNVKPAINRSGTIHSRAEGALARTHVRKVGKSYASEGIKGSNSRISPPRIRSSSQRAVRSDSAKKGASSSRFSGSRVSSRSPSESSSSSARRDRSAGRGTSSRFTGSSSTIKTYPSKQRSSSSRSRATSSRSTGADKKARVTAGSSVKKGKTYVPGKSIKYYRSRNSSRSSTSTSEGSTTQSKSSKAKTTKSKKNYTARQSSSREYAPSSRYSSSSRSQSSVRRSSSSSLSPRSNSSRSAQRSSSRYTAPSRSYSRSRTSAPKYSSPPRSSSSSRSSYSRSPKSSSKSYSKSTRSRSVRSSSSSRSSGKTSSSSSKSSSRTRKK